MKEPHADCRPSGGAQEVTVTLPIRLSARHLDAVRADPLCALDDREQMFTRLGWLVCAYDAIVKAESGGFT